MAGADDKSADANLSGDPPGRMLSRARREQGLKADEVAARLHLSITIIEAIENDDDTRLPAPIYVRGYLRKYAALVGLSGDELVEGYNARCGDQSPPLRLDVVPAKAPLTGTHRPRNWWLIGGSAAMLLLIGMLVLWLANRDEPAPVRTPVPAVQDAPPPARPAPARPHANPVTRSPGKSVSTQPAERKERPAAAKTGATKAEKTAPASGGGDIITIRFHEASWVDIRDADGKRLLFRTAKPGSAYRLRGRRPFSVYLGNAPGVDLQLNGKPVNLKPHTRRSRTARLILGR